MNAASPNIILERLKEEWIGIADASIYRELELEKQLWMLVALKGVETGNLSVIYGLEPSPLASKKLLSLYENKGTSTHLMDPAMPLT